MFLIEAGIILTDVNVIFNDKVEEIRYNPKDIPDELGINKDWES